MPRDIGTSEADVDFYRSWELAIQCEREKLLAQRENEARLQAALTLARRILEGREVKLPVQIQLKALAQTVEYLAELQAGR